MATTQHLIIESFTYHYFSIDQYGPNKVSKTACICMNLYIYVFVKQVAVWIEESNQLNQTSFIHWCSRLELNNVPLCHQGSSFRCSTKGPPPLAQQGSDYKYDYSRYSFDIVTLQVCVTIFDIVF